MHPTEIKYKKIASATLAIACVLTLFNIIHNPYNILGLGVVAIITFANKMQLKHRLLLFTMFVVFVLALIDLIEFGHRDSYSYSNVGLAEKCLTSFIYVALILSLPLSFIYVIFMGLIKAMEHEKKHYRVIKYSPHLICKTHLVKTLEEINYGFKSVSCRIGKTCLEKKMIVRAKEIIGLVGLEKKDPTENNNYYITLWDFELEEIHHADYDVVEIHENPGIEDYNGIISKIVSFFYNELERYKPLNEMVVRIVGNPPISESTKRLLKERFSRVEYIII